MGVFVCDGECDSLNNEFYCVEKFSQADIIQEVFRVNTSLSFVVILTPEEHHQVGTANYLKGFFTLTLKQNFQLTKISFKN